MRKFLGASQFCKNSVGRHFLLEQEREKMRKAIAKAERFAQQLRSQGLDPEV